MKIDERDIIKISDIGFVFKNFYTDSDSILEKFSSFQKQPYRIGEQIRVEAQNNIDIFNSINSFFIKAFQFYCEENSLNYEDYIINNQEALFVIIWEPGGSIGSHTDFYKNENDQIIETDISAIIYLTEDFEGADFVFEKEGAEKEKEEDTGPAGISIIPKKGDLLIFRSNAPHHVNKLISGRRITVTQAFIKKGKYEI
jgi:hypothetical protein